MKHLLSLSLVILLAAGAYAVPNKRVLRSFEETFSSAKNVKWSDYENFYTVTFSYSGIQSRVNYDKMGNILLSIRYYNPSMLPLNIYTRLKRELPTKKLFGVTEVSRGGQVVYFVKVESAKHWTTLKVDSNGDSVVVERYRKA